MKRILCCLFLVSDLGTFSQTGPAGIGTSSNNVFWLKADKGTSSTVNGTAISSWNDQSGNGINMSQTVAAQQPSFSTNIINGFPAVQFDNVSNTNDKMIGPDSPILDNTNGYSFFTVSRPQNLDGNARVLVSKRTTVSVDQSFMLFYYTGNKLAVDIQTTDDRFFTNTTFSSNNNYLLDVFYNGALTTNSRVSVYDEEVLDKIAAETASMVPDNASPIILGTTDASDPRPYGGYMSEIIIYRQALLPAERIIINNYLSAKYDIPLSADDKYQGDGAPAGNYDFEVAGVGKESTGSSTSFSPSIAGGLGISVNSGLDNGDYLLAGHASMTNSQVTTDVGGMSGVNNARWLRIWNVDITDALTTLNTNIEFDMSDGLNGATVTPSVASNYVLLYRSGQSGNWTELATASAIAGDQVLFNNIATIVDGYYTIGTKNYLISSLPIELIDFEAKLNGKKVDLNWSTATEKNNAYFSVEKTKNGADFETIGTVPGAGNSTAFRSYSFTDPNPYEGIFYYRLKQTNLDNSSTYSSLSAVEYLMGDVTIYPNPTDGILYITGFDSEEVALEIINSKGESVFSKTYTSKGSEPLLVDTNGYLVSGPYLVKIVSGSKTFTQKIIFK